MRGNEGAKMKAFVEEGATEGTKTRLQLLINFYSPSEFYINICRKRCNFGIKTMLQHFSCQCLWVKNLFKNVMKKFYQPSLMNFMILKALKLKHLSKSFLNFITFMALKFPADLHDK